MMIHVKVFWVETLCSGVVGYQHFFTLKMEAAWCSETFYPTKHDTASQPSEDGGSMDLQNVDILPQRYTASEPSEDGGSMDLRNIGILPQHYMASQPRRLRLVSE